ncbi:MAG: CHASE2 domain-containing protein, partial [Terrimicrobiaceae bacterium]|nr:CHASE2 domain-containing protein [Terrimicrobiaceae bacterium]
MRRKVSSREWRALAAAGLAAFAASLPALTGFGPFATASRSVSDWLVKICPKRQSPLEFALVGIDPSSLALDQLSEQEISASRELKEMAAGFPWPRSVYAGAIEKLLGAGARLVILDVLLPGPRAGDDELRRALARHPGRVVLVSNFAEDAGPDGAAIVRYQPPAAEVVPEDGAPIGFANFWREDGVVRSAPFRMRRPGGDEVFSSPAVALGLLKGGAFRDALPKSAHFLASRRALRPEVHIPLWQLFSPREWEANLRSGQAFEGRVVAIGATAPQFHD